MNHDADCSASPASRSGRSRPGWQPRIDVDRCTGCGWCVAVCEPHVLSLESVAWKKRSVIDDAASRCTGCSDCAVRCPVHAITMRRRIDALDPGA